MRVGINVINLTNDCYIKFDIVFLLLQAMSCNNRMRGDKRRFSIQLLHTSAQYDVHCDAFELLLLTFALFENWPILADQRLRFSILLNPAMYTYMTIEMTLTVARLRCLFSMRLRYK